MEKFEKLLDLLASTPMEDAARMELQRVAVQCRTEFLYEQRNNLKSTSRADCLDTVIEQMLEQICNRIGSQV